MWLKGVASIWAPRLEKIQIYSTLQTSIKFGNICIHIGDTFPRVWPGVRVILRSEGISVGVDLFHVALPGYHLLAVKEDPERHRDVPPVASNQIQMRSFNEAPRSSRASTVSSINDTRPVNGRIVREMVE